MNENHIEPTVVPWLSGDRTVYQPAASNGDRLWSIHYAYPGGGVAFKGFFHGKRPELGRNRSVRPVLYRSERRAFRVAVRRLRRRQAALVDLSEGGGSNE